MRPFSSFLAVTTIIITLIISTDLRAEEKKEAARTKQIVLNLDVNQAENLLAKNKEITILDVRTPKEFAQGHLQGATNVDFYASDFQANLSKLDKDKSYLVYCAVGGRSAKARDQMEKLDMKRIYHLDGGMKAWEKAGKKTEK